ncbi:MAG: DUF982 domain-containing protein [Phyllobacterium sp.]|jgi:hypothetical protein|uniref:DUF982 domain-containing protein n=1 Tax=Phyllobacterium sp. TaxID=1871046 RepID=UPI000DDC002D
MSKPMEIRPFGIAIDVKPGGYRVVKSIQQMSEILLDRWPEDKRNDDWEVARAACARALDTWTSAEAARAAFIMAAQAANIHVDADASGSSLPKVGDRWL